MSEDVPKRKRKSLRNSVLKHPTRNQFLDIAPHRESQQGDDFSPMGIFKGFGPMFDRDEEGFSPFGFGGFGHMDHFGDHLNEMMRRFFSDFQPESFADSQYYGEDQDLDDDISRKGLDKALERKPQFDGLQTFSGGFSHSESMTRRPDGTTEKRVTRKDSQGNVEATVTITHPDGTQETTSNNHEPQGGLGIMQDNIASDFDGGSFTPSGKGLFEIILDKWRRFF